MSLVLRKSFFLFVRFSVLILLGLNIRHKHRLPAAGPAIIVANHNSHLDTMVLMSIFPFRHLAKLRPVAAVDYFMKNRVMKWFALSIIGTIPIERGKASKTYNPLEKCCEALKRGEMIIIYPEGTRGTPENMAQFKKGIAYLSEQNPVVPVIPVFMHGLGKALPKGEIILVPFFCDVYIGEALQFEGDKNMFMEKLNASFLALAHEGNFPEWE